ncbi:hypothetical protein [Sphingomonas azotifigens]|uniref:hypothetical protein n=1 Tax=Sphingomonas azotifigens TaxID=330920 RepID=UPI000A008391|nr:hypothetical protein [Sphingomonas azotifigens]
MTELDLEIAAMLYPVLVEAAPDVELLPFRELIRRAQVRYPDSAAMQRQVPVGIGSRLATIRAFTEPRGYPDLTCLAVSTGRDVPPENYHTDARAEQARVAAFDWSKVAEEFTLQIGSWRSAMRTQVKRPRAQRQRELAVELMYAYYSEHKTSLPPAIRDHREAIIAALMAGQDVADAFAAVVQAMRPEQKATAARP